MTADLFSLDDREELTRRGVSVEEAERQVEILRRGTRGVILSRPAMVGDGIERLSPDDLPRLERAADAAARSSRLSKFVPASGAASRMFRDLIEADLRGDESGEAIRKFRQNLERFPFSESLLERLEVDPLRTLLDAPPNGLGLPHVPKGLIPFHREEQSSRTAFAEQLYEAASYATDAERLCRVHFTVAPEHQPEFEQHLAELRPQLEGRTGARFEVTFSVQHPSSDTLSLSPENVVARQPDGRLLFRPAGHGSLLRNLEELGGDLVVVKNIDNVVPARSLELISRWKRLLIGHAVLLQQQCFEHLRRAAEGGERQVEEGRSFIRQQFGRELADGGLESRDAVLAALRRPLRVVGVVRNEGEPGGAPFWVWDSDGSVSLQVVESAQVDHGDIEQEKIWNSSTHFNPVDIVCALRDEAGNPYPLQRFVDPEAVFIATKSHRGVPLRVLERPGLWNGSMARWNSVCVEVPAATFAPVKTVFDLLRSEHQA